MANKILQAYIDEAKRDAESISTGWSSTLLAYVWELEAQLKEARGLLAEAYEMNGYIPRCDGEESLLRDWRKRTKAALVAAHEGKGEEK